MRRLLVALAVFGFVACGDAVGDEVEAAEPTIPVDADQQQQSLPVDLRPDGIQVYTYEVDPTEGAGHWECIVFADLVDPSGEFLTYVMDAECERVPG